MHAEALDYVTSQMAEFSCLEIGSLDVNGGIRHLFPAWSYIGIDKVMGPGVTLQADGATFKTPKRFDVVVCCEAFEHTENWEGVVKNVASLLKPHGRFIGTAAGPERNPHTCMGHLMSTDPKEWTEWYKNIDPDHLRKVLWKYFKEVSVQHYGPDVRWTASSVIISN